MEKLRQAYHRHGFAVAEAVVSSTRVSAAVAAIEAVQAAAKHLSPGLQSNLILERELPAAKRGGIAPEDTGDAIFILGDPPAFDHVFAALAVDPSIVELVQSLLGSKDIRYHFSNVTMKRKRVGSGISWHRDFPNRYICPRSASFVRVMVCLDGMDEHNGATQFIPSSHNISDEDARKANALSVEGAVMETVTCSPGALVFIHLKVVHGGPPNASSRHRRNFIVQWGRADDPISSENNETLSGLSVPEIRDWLSQEV